MGISLTSVLPFIGSAASSVWNAKSQQNVNEDQINWARESMNTQRQWALDDWDRQNNYNSPSSQMQRFKDAGLNPNLIYGQNNVSQAVRSSPSEAPRLQAPQFDFGTIISAVTSFFDVMRTQAQTNNIEAQTKNAETTNRLLLESIYTKQNDRDIKNSLFPFQLQASDLRNKELAQRMLLNNLKGSNISADTTLKESQNKKVLADTLFTQHEDLRKAALTSANLQLAASKLLNDASMRTTSVLQRGLIQEQINRIQQDQRLRNFDEELQKHGIDRSNPWYIKMLHEIVTNPQYDIRQVWDKFKDKLPNVTSPWKWMMK